MTAARGGRLAGRTDREVSSGQRECSGHSSCVRCRVDCYHWNLFCSLDTLFLSCIASFQSSCPSSPMRGIYPFAEDGENDNAKLEREGQENRGEEGEARESQVSPCTSCYTLRPSIMPHGPVLNTRDAEEPTPLMLISCSP